MSTGDERKARLAAALRANLRRRKETALPTGAAEPAPHQPDPAASPRAGGKTAPGR